MITESILQSLASVDTEKYSYTKGELLCRFIDGQWVCKKMIKDPNYNGNRYIWETDLNLNK